MHCDPTRTEDANGNLFALHLFDGCRVQLLIVQISVGSGQCRYRCGMDCSADTVKENRKNLRTRFISPPEDKKISCSSSKTKIWSRTRPTLQPKKETNDQMQNILWSNTRKKRVYRQGWLWAKKKSVCLGWGWGRDIEGIYISWLIFDLELALDCL